MAFLTKDNKNNQDQEETDDKKQIRAKMLERLKKENEHAECFGICKCSKYNHVASPSPDKSQLYHTTDPAFKELNKIIIRKDNVQSLLLERTFENNIQKGDWAQYLNDNIISAGIYRYLVPIRSIIYYPYTKQPLCILWYDYKKNLNNFIIFNVTGERIVTMSKLTTKKSNEFNYSSENTWYQNGNKKSEKMIINQIDETTNKMVLSDCSNYNVFRQWNENGILNNEVYYLDYYNDKFLVMRVNYDINGLPQIEINNLNLKIKTESEYATVEFNNEYKILKDGTIHKIDSKIKHSKINNYRKVVDENKNVVYYNNDQVIGDKNSVTYYYSDSHWIIYELYDNIDIEAKNKYYSYIPANLLERQNDIILLDIRRYQVKKEKEYNNDVYKEQTFLYGIPEGKCEYYNKGKSTVQYWHHGQLI